MLQSLVCPAEIRKICLRFGHFVAGPVVRYVAQVPSVTRVPKFRPLRRDLGRKSGVLFRSMVNSFVVGVPPPSGIIAIARAAAEVVEEDSCFEGREASRRRRVVGCRRRVRI